MMNQEDIFKKIGLILDELQDQYAYLAQNPKQFNELELELFMANANFLSDHVQIVQKLNNIQVPKQLPEHSDDSGGSVIQQAPELPVADKAVENHAEERLLFEAPKVQQPIITDQPEPVAITEQESSPKDVFQEVPVVEIKPEPIVETSSESAISPIEEEVFKLDKEPSTFEFILKDIGSSDRFEFEEKSVDDIFDRPLSKEEEQIIAQKQKLREQQLEQVKETTEEDEIGPEPFLVEQEEEIVPVPVSPQLHVDEPEQQEVTFKAAPAIYNAPEPEPKAEETTAKPTLNELLASQRGIHNINSDKSKSAITDLKQGINLNDKMLYIKDLFNGYNLAYAEVIDLINKMPDFKSADTFLQNNYAIKNNWAARQATVDKFYELLNQRFQAK